MEEQEQHYTRGFNHGYLLAQHEPELAKLLGKHPNDQSDYFRGLLGGKQEYERETREWAKSMTKGGHQRDEQQKDKER